VNDAVAAAKTAFESFSAWSKEDRVALFERIVAKYAERNAELGKAISDEMGAPLDMAVREQAGSGLGNLKNCLADLKDFEFSEEVGTAHVVREPIGVVGMITPWNWPLNQITLKVGAAIAAGCTMVLKPSEYTPTSAKLFAEVMEAAGTPPGVFNLVQGDGLCVGRALSEHPDIQMMSFTGSTRAGIDVAQRSAPTVKRVVQELGGKSPNVILDDEDFEKGVKRGVKHVFHNCGQSCNAPTRMLVPAGRMEEAMKIAKALGDGWTATPVVNKVQFDRIQTLIKRGVEEATLVCGGPGRPEGVSKGYFIRPTVFGNCTNQMDIAQQEIFGPVLSIIPYNSIDEAIQIANDTPYGLAGWIQGKDEKTLLKLARGIRAGNIGINGTPAEGRAAFGGYKASGNGREDGKYGIMEFTEVKCMVGLPKGSKL
jgi:aldehyde dehydrogenase (NAD+)